MATLHTDAWEFDRANAARDPVDYEHRVRAARDRYMAACLAASGRAIGALLARLAVQVGAWFAARQRRQAAERELQGLDDRTLTDIGIARGDIAAIALSAANADGSAQDRHAA